MSLAYTDTTAENLSGPALATDQARRRHLFDIYIARMFHRKVGVRPYDDEQTKQHLSWLAHNMQGHNQEVFLIEGLQPSWLQTSRWRLVYTLTSRLLSMLIIGLIIGLFFARDSELVAGMVIGLIIGLIIGLPVSIINILRFEWLDKWRVRKGIPDFWWTVINIASVGLVGGLVGGLIGELYHGQFWLGGGLFEALIDGAIVGLIFGVRGSRKSLMNDIQAVEALQWHWSKALRGWLIGGPIGGLLSKLYGGMDMNGLLMGGLLFGLMGAVFYGLRPGIIETKSTPNQGIRLSVKYAVIGGLIIGLIGGLIYLPVAGLMLMLGFGLTFGLLGALWYGGLDVIQHYTLRLIIVFQGHTPANYARFLDYAVDRIFLQKVGGGYRFIHRLLLEHFADMDETSKNV
jgi:hypothetical protein